MARITYVKAAQQRYATVPVIDPQTGEQKLTPVTKGGKQKVTKRGKPVFLRVTEADKSQPLPNRKCGKCGKEIEVGQPYKHISPRSGPYGGRTLYRCGDCPSWRVWEYSSSLSARLAEVSYNFDQSQPFESYEDAEAAVIEAAGAVREIAQEKEESAGNIEDGFGHETTQSSELRDIAEQLESWADDIEQAEIPDYPEAEEGDCTVCEGTGQVEDEDCEECSGEGTITPEEPTDDQISEWQSDVQDALSIINESPV